MSLNTNPEFYVIGNSRINTSTWDGGGRILCELLKRWVNAGCAVNVLTTSEGYEGLRSYGLLKARFILLSPKNKSSFNLYLIYILRFLRASIWALTVNIPRTKKVIIYSGSDFWPDSIPSWILKLRFRHFKWVAAFYLFAPSPFNNLSPYKGVRRIRGLFYYFSQMPAYAIIRRCADMVWVTSEPDRWKFGNRLSPEKIVAVRGGVDSKTPTSIPEPTKKKFDGVFIGRFHPQKGILELVDIWRFVCEKRKSAKLAVIGVGDLEGDLRKKISDYGLENNVVLFGFKDGVEKLKIFKDSKVVVHPAIYDSGGMAACEAMACGLPGVSFDLPSLKTYYPKGMIKTQCHNLKAFAENILKLLTDEQLYDHTAKDALEWAKEWDWDRRAEELLDCLKK